MGVFINGFLAGGVVACGVGYKLYILQKEVDKYKNENNELFTAEIEKIRDEMKTKFESLESKKNELELLNGADALALAEDDAETRVALEEEFDRIRELETSLASSFDTHREAQQQQNEEIWEILKNANKQNENMLHDITDIRTNLESRMTQVDDLEYKINRSITQTEDQQITIDNVSENFDEIDLANRQRIQRVEETIISVQGKSNTKHNQILNEIENLTNETNQRIASLDRSSADLKAHIETVNEQQHKSEEQRKIVDRENETKFERELNEVRGKIIELYTQIHKIQKDIKNDLDRVLRIWDPTGEKSQELANSNSDSQDFLNESDPIL